LKGKGLRRQRQIVKGFYSSFSFSYNLRGQRPDADHPSGGRPPARSRDHRRPRPPGQRRRRHRLVPPSPHGRRRPRRPGQVPPRVVPVDPERGPARLLLAAARTCTTSPIAGGILFAHATSAPPVGCSSRLTTTQTAGYFLRQNGVRYLSLPFPEDRIPLCRGKLP